MNAACQPGIAGIDTHAHIFRRGLPLDDVRRYTPDYDASLDAYLRNLRSSGLSHGVLVQPSFLGTDNSFMLAALRQYPDQLRGIAMVKPDISGAELDAMVQNGVVGIRLNLIGQPLADYGSALWTALFQRLERRQMQVEIHRQAKDLDVILPPILSAGVAVVVDHFGRPDPALGMNDPGFTALLKLAGSGRLWVKLSGSYRNSSSEADARTMTRMLRDAFGVERLLWGSDWPHTQFEGHASYAEEVALIRRLLPDDAERRAVLAETPAALFRFPRKAASAALEA